MLAGHTEGAVVLDLYAGTGAIGIDALSRGAARCCFVESHRKALDCLRFNLMELELNDRSTVLAGDAVAIVRRLQTDGPTFTLAFVDPPFERGLCSPVLSALTETQILTPEAVVVVRRHKRESLDEGCYGWVKYKERTFGESYVEFFHASRTVAYS